MTPYFGAYSVCLEPLSPIHIGAGDALEPFSYLLELDDGECWLVRLDLDTVLTTLTPPQRVEFARVIDTQPYHAVREWLRKHAPRQARMRDIPVQQTAFRELLKATTDADRLGEVHLFIHDPSTAHPYIPGSSLKGAVRTALVDAAARARDHEPAVVAAARNGAARDFEPRVLGYAGDRGPDLLRDPMRQLAFSDLTFPEGPTVIDRTQIVRRPGANAQQDTAEGIQMYREMTFYRADGGEPTVARGELRVHRALTDRGVMREKALPLSFDVTRICSECNAFYVPRLRDESARFPLTGGDAKAFRESFDAAASALKPNQCIVRLGHHSHFECVTVSAPWRRPPEKGFGASRTYAHGQVPLGWALLTFEARP